MRVAVHILVKKAAAGLLPAWQKIGTNLACYSAIMRNNFLIFRRDIALEQNNILIALDRPIRASARHEGAMSDKL